ncbi:MAG: hypothetical protein Rpha_1311 [Candidatus Ruthia sp. Apha_13_S6]|nr:hypothetical protein [Candidatus Ruthia sp. Apha_13_S6]
MGIGDLTTKTPAEYGFSIYRFTRLFYCFETCELVVIWLGVTN